MEADRGRVYCGDDPLPLHPAFRHLDRNVTRKGRKFARLALHHEAGASSALVAKDEQIEWVEVREQPGVVAVVLKDVFHAQQAVAVEVN